MNLNPILLALAAALAALLAAAIVAHEWLNRTRLALRKQLT